MRPLAIIGVCVGLTACGYVGEPLPPAARFPAPVTDLKVAQRGAFLEATFTLPAVTLEGLPITQKDAVELRIGAAQWPEGAREYKVEWPKEGAAVTYRAEAKDWAGQDVTIGVRLANPKGRLGGFSNLVSMKVVEPLLAPAEIRVEEKPEGLRFTWRGRPGLKYRIQKQDPMQAEPVLLATVDKAEYLDENFEYDRLYRYTIQAFQTVGETEALSEPSAPFEITPKDKFPPAAPTGLTALVGVSSIELAWDRSSDFDFAFYRVYRSLEGAAAVKVGETGANPSYSDRDMQAGKAHRYTVTAVDKRGNESPASAAAEVRP